MARLPVCRSAKARAYRAATHSLQLADSNYKKQCFGTAFLLFNFVNGIMDFIKGKKRFLEIPGLQISY